MTSMDVGRLGNVRHWLQADQWHPIALTVAPGDRILGPVRNGTWRRCNGDCITISGLPELWLGLPVVGEHGNGSRGEGH